MYLTQTNVIRNLTKDEYFQLRELCLDNLATCVTNTGTSFIMDGRRIKAINQSWNKRKAKLQSVLSKQKLYK